MEEYKKVKLLGIGGFGSVYLAKDRNNHGVALKEISLFGLKEEDKIKKCKEALLLSSLNHPHIIKYYNHAVTHDMLSIYFELAMKGSLKDFINARGGIPFLEPEILHMFCQILLAVDYLHNLNIVHRDLCGENILVCEDNTIKLGDFGLSKNLDVSSISSGFVGRYTYMAPELFHGRHSTKETDIWSLGCLLYYMASLKAPFKKYSLADLMDIVENKSRFSALINQLTDINEIKKLIKEIMQIEPKNRPTTTMLLSHPLLALSVAKIPLLEFADPEKELHDLRKLNSALKTFLAK